jgi:hypothetical protein
MCVYVYVARLRLGKKRYRGNEYTRKNRRIVGRVISYAARVVSKESRRLVLPRTLFFKYRVSEKRGSLILGSLRIHMKMMRRYNC